MLMDVNVPTIIFIDVNREEKVVVQALTVYA